MIIEGLEIQTDAEDGNKLIVTGRSLESILDRRIVWKQTEIDGNMQSAIYRLINENIISPTSSTGGSNRQISNFVFETSTDSYICAQTLKAQYTGDNIYDILSDICKDNQIGFRINLNDSNQFCFKLYTGLDRSYEQTVNPYVCFSASFENIINSNYQTDISSLKNISLVGGEGEGTDRTFAISYVNNEPAGLNRRELFTDASSTSTSTYDEEGTEIVLTDAEYAEVLKNKGVEELVALQEIQEFESEIDATQQYKLGEDFSLGDYVQIVNEYGIEGKALITEIVTSLDNDGKSFYPAFVLVKTFDELYEEIEYIQSSGTQWIVTGIKGDAKSIYDIQFLNLARRELMGYGSAGNEYWGVTAAGKYEFGGTNTGISAGNRDSIIWDYKYNQSSTLTRNGTVISTQTATIDASTHNLKVFTIYDSPDASYTYLTHTKLYNHQIYQSGSLVRDFIPVKRKADNKPGLYDKISRKFFTNKGTGEFIIPT